MNFTVVFFACIFLKWMKMRILLISVNIDDVLVSIRQENMHDAIEYFHFIAVFIV